MYNFVDDEGPGKQCEEDELFYGSTEIHLETSSKDWNRIHEQFYDLGYREGISAGKDLALQQGFDQGFENVGAPVGRRLGILRGVTAGLRTWLNSVEHQCSLECSKLKLQMDIQDIASRLNRLSFSDIEPADTEAVEHELKHMCTAPKDEQQTTQRSEPIPERQQILDEVLNIETQLQKILIHLQLEKLTIVKHKKYERCGQETISSSSTMSTSESCE